MRSRYSPLTAKQISDIIKGDPSYSFNTVITIAASDSSDTAKNSADVVCDGTKDEECLNAALVTIDAAGGGKLVLADGTFNIWTYVNLRAGVDSMTATPANIVIEGQSWNTTLQRELVSGQADSYSTTTLNATSGVFESSMAGDASAVQFDTSGNLYDIVTFVDSDTVVLDADCSGEAAGDTFKISTVNHVIWQEGAGENIYIRDLHVDGQNFGNEDTAQNKCVFINGNESDWTKAHHIGLDRLFMENARSEASVMDYGQYFYTKDCRTRNSSWAGVGLAQVRYGELSSNFIETPGTIADPAGAGVTTQHYGVNMQATTECIARDNWVVHPRGGGIAVQQLSVVSPNPFATTYGCGNNQVVDNHIYLCEPKTSVNGVIVVSGSGVDFPAVGNVVKGNTISGNLERGSGGTWRTTSGTTGIYLRYCRDTSVLNNIVTGFSNTGIYAVDGSVRQTYYNGNYVGYFYTNDIFTGGGSIDDTLGDNFDLDDSNLSFTANAQLQPTDSGGRRVDNAGAAGTISLSLPKAVPGLIFDIVQTTAQFIHVLPQQGDSIAISVGGGQNVATDGDEYVRHQLSSATLFRTILCEVEGEWECKALSGTSSWIDP